MTKQCDENEVKEVEKIHTIMIPYRALILSNKIEYIDDYVDILHKFNILISKIEEKYNLINVSIQFNIKTVTGDKKPLVKTLFEDSNDFFKNIKYYNAYKTLSKYWKENDKIDFNYLLENVTKYNNLIQDTFNKVDNLKNVSKLYYIYKDNSVMIVRE